MDAPERPPSDQTRQRRLSRLTLPALVLTVCLALVALLTFGLLKTSPNTNLDDALARGEAIEAPAFELPIFTPGNLGPTLTRTLAPALRDGRIALEELRGTPLVLNFWASWCDPCREEMPILQRAWRTQARADGVLFLGLDMQDSTDDARAFLRQYDISYLNIRDQNNDVARDYGVTGLPETIFIDRDGRAVGHVVGAINAAQIRDGIAAATSGRPSNERRARSSP